MSALDSPTCEKFHAFMKVAPVPPIVVPRMLAKCSDALSLRGLCAHDMHMHAVACPGMPSTKAYQKHASDLSIKADQASSVWAFDVPVDSK